MKSALVKKAGFNPNTEEVRIQLNDKDNTVLATKMDSRSTLIAVNDRIKFNGVTDVVLWTPKANLLDEMNNLYTSFDYDIPVRVEKTDHLDFRRSEWEKNTRKSDTIHLINGCQHSLQPAQLNNAGILMRNNISLDKMGVTCEHCHKTIKEFSLKADFQVYNGRSIHMKPVPYKDDERLWFRCLVCGRPNYAAPSQKKVTDPCIHTYILGTEMTNMKPED